MADYRDPKVTTSGRSGRGMGTWIGAAIAAVVLLLLIWWLWGTGDDVEVVEPVAPVEGTADPAAPVEGTAEEPATEPVAPAQQ